MARRASVKLAIVKLPKRWDGKAPPIGVSTVGHEDVDDTERDRVAAEAGKATTLFSKAKPAQKLLLERLARAAGERGLRFRSIAPLEAFVRATSSLDAKAAQAVSEDKLQALWKDAERHERAELLDTAPEPELRLRLVKRAKQKLAIDVVGRVEAAPAMPDRVAQEANIGAVLLDKASPAQVVLLDRLVRAAGSDGLRFPTLTPMTKFLASTRTLTPKAVAKLPDAELARLWQEASKD